MNDYLEPYREEIGKDAINALPMVSYDGPVRVVEREEELPEVLKLLQGDTLLGLDTEMRPCFERGKPLRPTALLQLAGERAVVLVRLKNVPISMIGGVMIRFCWSGISILPKFIRTLLMSEMIKILLVC